METGGRGFARIRALSMAAACLLGSFSHSLAAVAAEPATLRAVARSRVPFVENAGQLPSRFAFAAPTLFGTTLVTRDGRLIHVLRKAPRRRDGAGRSARPGVWTLTEIPLSGRARPTAGARARARVNSFLGNDPALWRTNLRATEEVDLGEVWPGVSVSFRAFAGKVERIFTVRPGARVERIRMRLRGAARLRIAADGALEASATDGGAARFSSPVAYQDRDGVRQPVSAAYVLRSGSYGFRLGEHDPARPIVIDPVLQSTYIGGAGGDSVNAIAVDPSTGEVLVAGTTFSRDFPRTSGGQRATTDGGVDGFVARFDPTLTTLLQATYVGGSGGEEILGLAVHPVSSDVYVAGYTSSLDLPGTSGGAQHESGGSDDGFVVRLDASLTQLLGATYFGGNNDDKIVGIAVHPSNGEIYVAGHTISEDLPGTAGGAQPMPAGAIEGTSQISGRTGFLARFDPTLGRLLQATYFGGATSDYIHALAIHPSSGEILVGGQTLGADLPATDGGANAGQPGNGNWDAFVARVDPTLTRFLQTTYLGGAGGDDVRGIAVHPSSGEILVAGWTNYIDFPATSGGAQPQAGGVWDPAANQQHKADGFVARFNPMLTALLQATYLGGGGDDYCYGIAVHPTRGDVYVTGETFSTDFPGTAGGAQSTPGGGDEGFIARLDPKLTRLVQATYLGGGADDSPQAIAIQPSSGEVLVAGATSSTDFPTVPGGAQPTYGGGSEFFGGDGFVTRFPAGLFQASSECVADANTLCLSGRRFAVRVAWSLASQGRSGAGVAVPLSKDTGYFWFFDSANVEVVVKVLDARAANGFFWVFYGALSNVDYTITVTDTDTGIDKTYSNPAGKLASVADTSAFTGDATGPGAGAAAGASAGAIETQSASELYAMYATLALATREEAISSAPCAAGSATLCLDQARFRVEVEWAVPSRGRLGLGTAVPVTPNTGYFWFFNSANVELVVKVLDGRPVNGHFWVFYGALSNVQYTITVTDTETGAVKKYDNASGTLASVADTSAF